MNEITLITLGKKIMSSIYLQGKLLWSAVRSCFGSGRWRSDKPWVGNERWKSG